MQRHVDTRVRALCEQCPNAGKKQKHFNNNNKKKKACMTNVLSFSIYQHLTITVTCASMMYVSVFPKPSVQNPCVKAKCCFHYFFNSIQPMISTQTTSFDFGFVVWHEWITSEFRSYTLHMRHWFTVCANRRNRKYLWCYMHMFYGENEGRLSRVSMCVCMWCEKMQMCFIIITTHP